MRMWHVTIPGVYQVEGDTEADALEAAFDQVRDDAFAICEELDGEDGGSEDDAEAA